MYGVCRPICRPLQQRAAGLLLRARVAGDIDQLLHGQRPAATAPQQQRRRSAAKDRVCGKCIKTVRVRRMSVPRAARMAAAKPCSGGRCASSAAYDTRPRKFWSD